MTGREARGGALVVGGGFAGGYVARYLGKRGATIVSRENFILHTPMPPEAASGTLAVVDWTVSLFFRRDIGELGMLGHPRRFGDD